MSQGKFIKHTDTRLVLFCGLPATLKTFLSVRLAGKLGYGYLPTRAVGEIQHDAAANKLQQARNKRYKMFARVIDSALLLGANVVADGGFPTSASRKLLLRNKDPEHVVIIHCVADEATRIQRLKKRSLDQTDYENNSALQILNSGKKNKLEQLEEDPIIELTEGRAGSILKVDTSSNKLSWKGSPPKDIRKNIVIFIKSFLAIDSPESSENQTCLLSTHFNDIATIYDDSTEWRTDRRILESLKVRDIPARSRVLDVGTGTGLASEWYAKKGHTVAGVDISPQMLQKAADRLTFVLLANATKMPFLNRYFDIVIVRQCLHYVEPARLLEEAERVLKKGGRIVISGAVCPTDQSKGFWKEFKNATQPLRLNVFTADDIVLFLRNAGFAVKREVSHSITRWETIKSIEKRSIPIEGGTANFLKNMNKLTASLFPELEFSFLNGVLTYKQYWATIWATKIK